MRNEGPPVWGVRGRTLTLDRPYIFGVLNVTPDSFSDGGRFFDAGAALEQARRMVDEGADAIDLGGESTRPQGARPVDAEEERRRVLPVLRELRRRLPETLVSVDTVKADVAAAALDEGAHVVNDVSGFRLDPRMGEICAGAGAGVVLMHSRGTVSEMGTYAHASYGADVVGEVVAELGDRVDAALASGVAAQAIAVDPGIGFGKRSEHSLRVLAELPRVAALGRPVLVGVSRKRFIGELTGVSEAAERVHGTTGASVVALTRGARLFRVHDVRAARHALDVAWAIVRAGDAPVAARDGEATP
jgi:dihydropteroate synthase